MVCLVPFGVAIVKKVVLNYRAAHLEVLMVGPTVGMVGPEGECPCPVSAHPR